MARRAPQAEAEGETLAQIETERARHRMLAGSAAPSGNISGGSAGETRDKVATAVGLGTGRTYEKAAKVWRAAQQGDAVPVSEIFREREKGRVSDKVASSVGLDTTHAVRILDPLADTPPAAPAGMPV